MQLRKIVLLSHFHVIMLGRFKRSTRLTHSYILASLKSTMLFSIIKYQSISKLNAVYEYQYHGINSRRDIVP
jgi:hypothetical protein